MSTAEFTSLHGGLIARKGEALPAPAISITGSITGHGFGDFAPPDDAARPNQPAGACAPVTMPAKPKPGGKGARIKAVTLRIEAAQYHRVHVAAAKLDFSGQDLLRAAVEYYLNYLSGEVFPDCGCVRGSDGCGATRT